MGSSVPDDARAAEHGTHGAPPSVWILTDEKAGHTTQSVGLADALGWPYERKDLVFNRYGKRSPRRLGASTLSLDIPRSAPLEPPWPDLVIATGKKAAPIARWIGEQSRGHTRLVQLGRKGGNNADHFDLTVTCTHFRQPHHRKREEILAPITAITPQRLADAAAQFPKLFADQPRPHVALLVGGYSAVHRLNADTARRIGVEVRDAVRSAGGTLLVVTSPRTGAAATAALQSAVGDAGSVYNWKRGDPENPYLASLALADVLVATGDSESMLAEAISSGKALYVYDLPTRAIHTYNPGAAVRSWVQSHAESATGHGAAGSSRPLATLCARLLDQGFVESQRDLGAMHSGLYEAGLARPFGEPLQMGWTRPWSEVDRVAARVRELLGMTPHGAGDAIGSGHTLLSQNSACSTDSLATATGRVSQTSSVGGKR